MNTRLIAAAEAVMVAAVMLAAGCGSAATSAPTPTPSPTHSVMSPAASSTSPSPVPRPTGPAAHPAYVVSDDVSCRSAACLLLPHRQQRPLLPARPVLPQIHIMARPVWRKTAQRSSVKTTTAGGGYGSTARPPAPARSPPRPPPPAAAARPGSRTPCCSGSAWRRCWPAPGAWPTAGGSPGNADQGSGR